MSLNRKLTPIIKGRIIQSVSWDQAILRVSFTDDSAMTIKTGPIMQTAEVKERKIKAVRQRGTVMNLDFADGTSMTLDLAEAASSVMLRDRNGTLEYAD